MRSLDPRWILITNNTILLVTGIMFFQMQRPLLHLGLGLVASIALDWLTRRPDEMTPRWYMSAVACSLSSFLFIRSSQPLIYVFTGLICALTKRFFRGDSRMHSFNPSNIAVLFAYLVMARDELQMFPDQFALMKWPVIMTFVLGTVAVAMVNRWRVTLFFFLGCLAGSTVYSWVSAESVLMLFGPQVGLTGVLFAFFMITDPKTSPTNGLSQIGFGLAIGLLTCVLRIYEIFLSDLLSLYLICLAVYAAKLFKQWTASRADLPTRSLEKAFL